MILAPPPAFESAVGPDMLPATTVATAILKPPPLKLTIKTLIAELDHMASATDRPAAPIEQDWRDLIKDIFENKLPFNRLLGIEVLNIDGGTPRLGIKMREALVGNFMRGSLHGGVISAVIDVTGGLAAFLSLNQKIENEPLKVKVERFSKLGTIDLRIDYLRPGLGRRFVSSGQVLRTGNKVAVTRIEFKNDENQLIAVGTGAYVIA